MPKRGSGAGAGSTAADHLDEEAEETIRLSIGTIKTLHPAAEPEYIALKSGAAIFSTLTSLSEEGSRVYHLHTMAPLLLWQGDLVDKSFLLYIPSKDCGQMCFKLKGAIASENPQVRILYGFKRSNRWRKCQAPNWGVVRLDHARWEMERAVAYSCRLPRGAKKQTVSMFRLVDKTTEVLFPIQLVQVQYSRLSEEEDDEEEESALAKVHSAGSAEARAQASAPQSSAAGSKSKNSDSTPVPPQGRSVPKQALITPGAKAEESGLKNKRPFPEWRVAAVGPAPVAELRVAPTATKPAPKPEGRRGPLPREEAKQDPAEDEIKAEAPALPEDTKKVAVVEKNKGMLPTSSSTTAAAPAPAAPVPASAAAAMLYDTVSPPAKRQKSSDVGTMFPSPGMVPSHSAAVSSGPAAAPVPAPVPSKPAAPKPSPFKAPIFSPFKGKGLATRGDGASRTASEQPQFYPMAPHYHRLFDNTKPDSARGSCPTPNPPKVGVQFDVRKLSTANRSLSGVAVDLEDDALL